MYIKWFHEYHSTFVGLYEMLSTNWVYFLRVERIASQLPQDF